jgi:glycerate 2-kinase
VGKAAAGMFEAFATVSPQPLTRALVVGPHRPSSWSGGVPFVEAGHPFATAESARAATLALELASGVPPDGTFVCLLSGGASALMAAPMDGLTLEAKQGAVRHVMTGGADIGALNAVRKHLSRVKGGRLAAACPGTAVTLAISDVIGDDLSVIGSGPCVPDASTWHDAARAVERFGGWEGLAADVRRTIEAGCRGERPDTPKPGDPRISRAVATVIAGRREAMSGAGRAARERGYDVVVMTDAVAGEARDAGPRWWDVVRDRIGGAAGRGVAVVSSGETTVRVLGRGRGGRNQEFALSLVGQVARQFGAAVLVSLGTDGIDGPTDAAGAVVDSTSAARAAALARRPEDALAANDSYPFFDALGDLVRSGPSGTNVGDLQVLLVDAA